MVFDIPFNVLALYVGLVMSIGMLGMIMAFKKIAGSPFITVSAGILLFALIVLIDNIEVAYVDEPVYSVEHPMNVTTSDTSEAFSATLTAQAERAINVQSVLVNKVINCIEVNMFRTGSPTQNVMIGIGDNDARMVKLFGNITATSINTATRSYQVCLPNHDYWIIAYNDYIMIKHTGSTPSNTISVNSVTTNPFDGGNSGKSKYTSGIWSDTSGHDLRMKLTTERLDIIGQPVLHNFNDTDTWAFIIFIAMLFIIIGSMVQFTKW